MDSIPTYELTHVTKRLKELSKRDMTCSGIRIEMTELDGTPIGEMDFVGELMPKLIPVLIESLTETLALRRDLARSDIGKIDLALNQE